MTCATTGICLPGSQVHLGFVKEECRVRREAFASVNPLQTCRIIVWTVGDLQTFHGHGLNGGGTKERNNIQPDAL